MDISEAFYRNLGNVYYYAIILDCLISRDIDKDEFGKEIRTRICKDGVIVTKITLDSIKKSLTALFASKCIVMNYNKRYSITQIGMKIANILNRSKIPK